MKTLLIPLILFPLLYVLHSLGLFNNYNPKVFSLTEWSYQCTQDAKVLIDECQPKSAGLYGGGTLVPDLLVLGAEATYVHFKNKAIKNKCDQMALPYRTECREYKFSKLEMPTVNDGSITISLTKWDLECSQGTKKNCSQYIAKVKKIHQLPNYIH